MSEKKLKVLSFEDAINEAFKIGRCFIEQGYAVEIVANKENQHITVYAGFFNIDLALVEEEAVIIEWGGV